MCLTGQEEEARLRVIAGGFGRLGVSLRTPLVFCLFVVVF